MDLMQQFTEGTGFENSAVNFPGIIHDVKNLMCAVICTAELMTSEIPDEHSDKKKLQMIIQIAQRSIDLLVATQTNESIYALNFEKIELKPLIDDVLSWINGRMKKDVSIELSCNMSDPTMFGNKTELESALLNLCINALESMSESGTLNISIYPVTISNTQNPGSPVKISQQTFVKIEISDTGAGIAPEKIPYIFNPFYSTKQVTGAPQRGMGLFRAKRCICAHGGTIEVQSVLSAGTTFTVSLPVFES